MKLLNKILHLNVKIDSGNPGGVYGSDGTIPVLSAYQLDIANKIIDVLTPVEELLRIFQ